MTALAQRDTVAKTIYSCLFDQITGIINGKLKRRKSSVKADLAKAATVGLLDIFGFEDMAINSFEQMFINLTSERLQRLFNSIMFVRVLMLYGSDRHLASFHYDTSNIVCVKLFTSPSKPPGIVKLLGESTNMKNGRGGSAFVSMFNSSSSGHRCYKVADPQDVQKVVKAEGLKLGGANRLDYRNCFQIKHFAGTVMYTVKEWVPKSMDTLLPHLTEACLNEWTTSASANFRVRTQLLLKDVFGVDAEEQHGYAFGFTKVFMQCAVFPFCDLSMHCVSCTWR